MKLSLSSLVIILFLNQITLVHAEIVITDNNKDAICPIAEQLMYNAYDRAYALSNAGKFYNVNNLKLAILSSQSYWDLYPAILNCPNAKEYEEQFSRLGINNANAKLERNDLQDLAKNNASGTGGKYEQSAIISGSTRPGSVILSGSQVPDREKLTISVPADIYKQQIQQTPSQ